MIVGLHLDGRVILMHLFFSVHVNVYLNHRSLFTCLGDLPAKGLPPVVDIPNKAFAARRSVCSVLQVDHVTYLGGISPVNWQMKSYKRAVKLVGVEYVDCACRGLMFVPPDCASWIFLREADGPLNISEVLTGLFPLLTSQEPPFREALDWFKLAYTADQVGDYVAPVSTVLAQSTVAEGDELLPS